MDSYFFNENFNWLSIVTLVKQINLDKWVGLYNTIQKKTIKILNDPYFLFYFLRDA